MRAFALLTLGCGRTALSGEYLDQRALWLADPLSSKLKACEFRVSNGLGNSTSAKGSEVVAVDVLSLDMMPLTVFDRKILKGNPSLINRLLSCRLVCLSACTLYSGHRYPKLEKQVERPTQEADATPKDQHFAK